MFAEKHYPEMMLPEELDAYLSKGWYRMGQTIFTTHFLCFGRTFYSAIWIRLPLSGYRFRKSLRKIYNRNRRQFRVEVGDAALDAEKERLYRRYKASFSGMLAPTLRDALLDGEDFNIYRTKEVRVYDGDRLIALSYFDIGQHSSASITGIYDPGYDKHSLGFYTMLEEIQYSQEAGLLYYYPGYVVPGYPRFSYKLRIGESEVEYFSLPHQGWRPYQQLEETQIPIHLMERKLSELTQYLQHQGITAEQLYYPLFEANLFGFWQAPYFDYPIFLLCSQRQKKRKFLCIVYNPRSHEYELLITAMFDDLQLYFNHSYTSSFDKRHNFVDLLVVESTLRSSEDPREMVELLKAGLGNEV
jgi:arginine-tRNA-protein transferase